MPGTFDNPYIVAPETWLEDGVPYGSYCKCCLCNRVERCFIHYDYYADNPGDYLRCETCVIGTDPVVPQAIESALRDELP